MAIASAPVYHFDILEPTDISTARKLMFITENKPVFEWNFDENFKIEAMKEIRTAILSIQKEKTIEF